MIQAINPESGVVNYAYDNVGNLISKTDNRGITTTTSYDVLNRPVQESYTDATPTVTYSYDAAGVPNAIGHLASVANSNSVTNFTGFAVMGHVVTSNPVTAGQTYTFSYGYNLARDLVSETYPSRRTLTTAYDGANRPASLSGSYQGAVTNYVRQARYAAHGAPAY